MNKLVVFNYCMDVNDRLLSHQVEIVNSLAPEYAQVYVVTGRVGTYQCPANVTVISTQWNSSSKFKSTLKFLKISISLLIQKRPDTIFSHMTEVQSALLSPVSRLMGIKHFLWYAHSHKSIYLRWASIWVTRIVTSTSGSCPIQSEKVSAIGQAIDLSKYRFLPKLNGSIQNFVHIGRFDPSKNIEMIIESVRHLRRTNQNLTLSIIGDPSTALASEIAHTIMKDSQDDVNNGWLSFKESIPRERVCSELEKYDCFVHAYEGSLDKSLIEATSVGLPVATINQEYINDFGGWSDEEFPSLTQQLSSIMVMDFEKLKLELSERRIKCENKHSLDRWVAQLVSIMQES